MKTPFVLSALALMGSASAQVFTNATSSSAPVFANSTSSSVSTSQTVDLTSSSATSSAAQDGTSSVASQTSTLVPSSSQVSVGSSSIFANQSMTASSSVTRTTVASSSTAMPASPTEYRTINGVAFKIELDITYDGMTFEIDITLAKRASESLADCLSYCASDVECIGTAYNSNEGTCTYYSSIDDGSRRAAEGIDFATVQSRNQAASSSAVSGSASATMSGSISASISGSPSAMSSSMSMGSFTNSSAVSSTIKPSGFQSTSVQSTASATASVTAESLICPKLDGAVITNDFKVSFTIDCSHGLIGATFTIDALSKRQNTGLPSSLSNCVDICSTNDACVATTFDTSSSTCTYYSSVTGSYIASGMDSALRIASGSSTQSSITSAPAGAVQTGGVQSTATVYSATVVTISSCAPTITDCPLRNGQNSAVVTEIVPVSETVYVCPLPTQNANVVTALYGAVTVQEITTSTVYECPVAGQTYTVGSSTFVPSVPTTITSTYMTQITQGPSSAPPAVTGADASKTVVYVQQYVSADNSATYTQYVVVSTATPSAQANTEVSSATPAGQTTTQVIHINAAPTQAGNCNGIMCPATTQAACNGEHCSTVTVIASTATVVPTQAAVAQCNGTNCPSSGMTTMASATASVSQPLAYTGAASVLSVQGGFVAIFAALFSFLML